MRLLGSVVKLGRPARKVTLLRKPGRLQIIRRGRGRFAGRSIRTQKRSVSDRLLAEPLSVEDLRMLLGDLLTTLMSQTDGGKKDCPTQNGQRHPDDHHGHSASERAKGYLVIAGLCGSGEQLDMS